MSFDPLAKDAVTQNLYDAGLAQDVVEQFLTLMEQSSLSQQLRFLAVQRSGLLGQPPPTAKESGLS